MNTKLSLSIYILIILLIQSDLMAQDGLVGYFPLNGTAEDESTIGIDGTMNNVLLTEGINDSLNTAFLFNGTNSSIYCGTDNRNISDTVSISAWVKTTSIENGFIVTKYNYNENKGFHFGMNEGYVKLGGRNNTADYTNTGNSSITVNDGEWHHIVGMIYGNTWEVWIDCELDRTVMSSASAPALANSEPLTIGNFNLDNSKYFDGVIDEVRIYNKRLSVEEISTLCQITIPVSNDEITLDDFELFPNPSQGILNIRSTFTKFERIEVYDKVGRIVSGWTYNGTEINLSKLANGIYFIKILDGNDRVLRTERVVLAKEA